MTDVSDRIRRLRKAKGLNQAALAQAIHVSQGTVSRWESGIVPEGENLTKLSQFFGKSVEEIIGLKAVNIEFTLKVVGIVEAGVFRESVEFDSDDAYEVAIPTPTRVDPSKAFGLEVHGDSMNQLYPDGSILVCVRLHDMPRDLRDKDRVIVYRRDGGKIEATCKELRMENGTPWLWPRSDDPKYQTPIRADADNDGIEIEIHAVVIGAYIENP